VAEPALSNDVPRLSAIVVAHRRPVLLRKCIESLRAQSEPSLEVVVVLNDAGKTTETVAEECKMLDARVTLVHCARVSASEARNHGVAAARSPIFYFLDDDVEVPPTGVSAVLGVYASQPGVSIVGGPNLTHPEDPEFSQITGELLGSSWGTGIARSRYTKRPPRWATERHLILCNLAIHRSVFEEGARFPLHFGGEENVLMGGADARGHTLWYSPDTWVYHHRRSSLRAYAMQMLRYGRGRATALGSAPRTFHPAYFAPVLLLAYLLLLPVLAFFTPAAWLPLGAYFLGSVAASTAIAVRRRKVAWLFLLPCLFLITHLFYAVGLVKGLLAGRGARARPPATRPAAS
jgi:glycosyltransferase involved in cell wall biosynthesis